ncbi:unnamed protein product [Larinioides sclopetarius]|uniref:Uncharacterized protein n=1 Tax=Larinioides sclopetarius TaxID=280406 RepID=A0AAV1ZGE8_9ARAC
MFRERMWIRSRSTAKSFRIKWNIFFDILRSTSTSYTPAADV